ncbi:MAG: ABC transporter substrate-binding protein [Chloroflexi bacterium]|nr:ABC transporter substrate-binding protein [Chloroflexota bacterium]
MTTPLDRRQFLRIMVSAASGFAVASCGPAAPAAPPAATPPPAPTTAAAKPAALTPAAAAPTAPATVAGGAPKSGGMLIIADRADNKTLDPAYISDTPSRLIGRAIYDTLVDVDEQGNIIPILAERWETPDPKTYVLHLKQGLKFTDGTEFDAAAVKFNIDRHLDPNTASKQRGVLLSVDSIDVPDKYTVRFNLKAPYAAFLSVFFDRVGFIASPTAVQKWGDKDYGLHPIGIGPFRLVDYKPDQQYVVERNPDYWDKGKPYLDGITWKAIPVDATRLVELRSGGAHMAEDLPLQDVERMRGMPEFKLSERSGARFYRSRWNMDDKFGSSLEFRQALNWLIDREAIHKAVFFDTGTIGYDPFLPGTPFFDAAYKPYTRDLDKARALLDKSGVPSPRTFTMHPDPSSVGQKLTQIFQANLAEVDINADIQNEDDAAWQARLGRGDWALELRSTSWFGWRPDPAQYAGTLWHSASTYYATGKLKDPDTDKLIEQGEAEYDPARRYQIYRQLADRLNELASTSFFQLGADFKGISPKVRGFVHMPDIITRYKTISLD